MAAYAEPCVYEARPGAACAPLPSGYRPRQPRRSVLHRVVRENLHSFLAEGAARSESGQGYPYYVEKEFRDYLSCGDPTRGFARIRCRACGHEVFLPPSCRNRGICPSCTGRRMSDEAAYLVDMVLPEAGYRQWTVTFPYVVRFLMARDHRLITAIFGIAVRLIFAWQRRQAKRAGHPGARPAAVGLVQRFGGGLNLNVHGHLIVPDGVFLSAAGETLRLLPLDPPENQDLVPMVRRLAQRVMALLERRFGTVDLGADQGPDSLDAAIQEAMTTPLSTAPDAAGDDQTPKRDGRRCVTLNGFSIHANTAVPAHNRVGLEQLCRYGMRPPFAQDRLSLDEHGRVCVALRRPWPNQNGVTVLRFEPATFLRRLASLIPPPYAHLVRHYGLFAPNAKGRDLLPAAPVTWQGIRPSVAVRAGLAAAAASDHRNTAATDDAHQAHHAGIADTAHPASTPARPEPADLGAMPTAPSAGPQSHDGPANQPATPLADLPTDPRARGQPARTGRPRRQVLPWADLLRRVFRADALVCPKCLGPMTVLAYITDPPVVLKILAHVGLPTSPLPLAPARLPPQLALWEGVDDDPSLAPYADQDRDRDGNTPATPPRAGPGPPAGTASTERWFDLDDPSSADTADWDA